MLGKGFASELPSLDNIVPEISVVNKDQLMGKFDAVVANTSERKITPATEMIHASEGSPSSTGQSVRVKMFNSLHRESVEVSAEFCSWMLNLFSSSFDASGAHAMRSAASLFSEAHHTGLIDMEINCQLAMLELPQSYEAKWKEEE
ncbi:hypothetical protein MKX01_017418 [Papaver californicum]|nr:hypothetical protein MKX01_017418 [Papaver californicum]